MEIQPIRNEADYREALRIVSRLVDEDPDPSSPDGEMLDVMATLVQAYEAKHYPIEPPDPIEAIRFAMEQHGLTVKDLVPMLGNTNRVYEILNRKRPLTLAMIRRLNQHLEIPAEILIRDPNPS
jgi:HTH-type transcriptional regulator/antitoxin HigA